MADGTRIYQGLLDRGFTPVQASALAGNIQQESGFQPAVVNKTSGAKGLVQWLGPRHAALNDYAEATGRSPDDVDTQLDYIVHEMQGPEAKSSTGFLAAKDIPTANAALKKYLRYGPDEGGKRLDYALSFANQPTAAAPNPAAGTFVNPANSGPMPATPTFVSPPAAASAVPGPDGAVVPDKSQARLPSATTDDALLKSFLEPAAPARAPVGPEDDLLKQFLPSGPPAAPAASADPLAGTKQLFPGADALSAAFTSGVEAIPIAGPSIMSGLEQAKSGLNHLLSGSTQTPEQVRAVDRTVQTQQPVASGIGTVVGTVAPFLVGGEIPVAAKALGMSGNLLTRMGMGGVSSAAIEYGDTLARGGSQEEAQHNALTAGLLGSGAAPAADLIGKGFNKLLGGTSAEVAKLAQLARDKFGIPIGPGQISENPMVRVADSVVNKMPLSGGTASTAAQQTAFNKAVANTFGESADHITPDVMARAKGRIGADFDAVAQKTPKIDYDPQLENALIKITDDANQVLQASEVAPIKNQIDAIVTKFGRGQNAIDGETYQAITRKGAPLDRLLSSENPNVRFYASQVREALDDALARYAPQEAQDLLKQARSQYKAMKTIEPLAGKAPTGDVSAPGLMGVVRGSYGDMAYGGGGDLADLARIGQRFLKAPPSSGTAERLGVMELGKKLMGPTGVAGAVVAGALNPGAIPMALAAGIPTAAAYATLAKLAGAGMRSRTLTNKLIQNSLGTAPKSTGGGVNKLLRAAVPLEAPRQPLKITINGGNPLLAQ